MARLHPGRLHLLLLMPVLESFQESELNILGLLWELYYINMG